MKDAAGEGKHGGSARSTLLRGLKFYSVGGLGIAVQLAMIGVFRSLLHLDYRVATAAAVEMTVIHNFLWHERFTWKERILASKGLARFAKFNLTNGVLSVVGNVVVMQGLVGLIGMHYLIANMLAIAACSVLNFVVSERFVFQGS